MLISKLIHRKSQKRGLESEISVLSEGVCQVNCCYKQAAEDGRSAKGTEFLMHFTQSSQFKAINEIHWQTALTKYRNIYKLDLFG